jgi:hypothetical protein
MKQSFLATIKHDFSGLDPSNHAIITYQILGE